MATINIRKGTDEEITLKVWDADRNLVDLSDEDIVQIWALVYSGTHHNDTHVLTSADSIPADNLLTKNDETSEITLKLRREKTKNYETGTLHIMVLIDYTDADYTNSIRREEFPQGNLGSVLQGAAQKI